MKIFTIELSPLSVPLKRRWETFAVFFWMGTFIFSTILLGPLIILLYKQRNIIIIRSEAQQFMKKLYAFKNIQQLVKLDTPSSKTRAKELSLENNFVTDLTSLVIPSQREEEVRVANLGENTGASGQDWGSTRMSQNYSPGVQTTSLQFGSNTHSPHSNQRSYLNHHGGPRSGTLYRYSSGSGVPGPVYRAGPRLRSGMSGPPGPWPSATTFPLNLHAVNRILKLMKGKIRHILR